MVLGEADGLKGRASRAGQPVAALDPANLTQPSAVMPLRAGSVRRPGVSFLLCAPGDISTLRRHSVVGTKSAIVPDEEITNNW
jgi:hypothetical protein